MADILLEPEQDSKPVNYGNLKHYNDKLTTQNDGKYLAKDKIGDGLSLDESGILSATGDTVYTLPVASTETLGGVKVDGSTISADANGVISAVGGGSGGDDNVIESIKVNGVEQTVNTDKSVDITVPAPPSKVSELENDSGYITSANIPASLPANGGNADTVNNHTVNADVPENAVFTDTVYTLPVATADTLGGIKVDGTTITATSDGTISAVGGSSDYILPVATASVLGGVKPDNLSIFVASNGIISAAPPFQARALYEGRYSSNRGYPIDYTLQDSITNYRYLAICITAFLSGTTQESVPTYHFIRCNLIDYNTRYYIFGNINDNIAISFSFTGSQQIRLHSPHRMVSVYGVKNNIFIFV